MRSKFLSTLALSAMLAASPAALDAAPDQTLGMALMSAVVKANGDLISGTGVKNVTHTGVGAYHVQFDRSVAGCTPVASPLAAFYDNFVTVNHLPQPTADTFLVLTGEVFGLGKNTQFSLIVFCGQ
jgi:hypothetical protein